SERCSLRQSDQHKAVDRCTNRNDGFLAEMLPGWTEETIGDESALVRDRWTVPIREEKRQQRKSQDHYTVDRFAAEPSLPLITVQVFDSPHKLLRCIRV